MSFCSNCGQPIANGASFVLIAELLLMLLLHTLNHKGKPYMME